MSQEKLQYIWDRVHNRQQTEIEINNIYGAPDMRGDSITFTIKRDGENIKIHLYQTYIDPDNWLLTASYQIDNSWATLTDLDIDLLYNAMHGDVVARYRKALNT